MERELFKFYLYYRLQLTPDRSRPVNGDWLSDKIRMLDSRLSPWIDQRTSIVAHRLHGRGVTVQQITLGGLAAGIAGALTNAFGGPLLRLALFLLNQLSDGLAKGFETIVVCACLCFVFTGGRMAMAFPFESQGSCNGIWGPLPPCR